MVLGFAIFLIVERRLDGVTHRPPILTLNTFRLKHRELELLPQRYQNLFERDTRSSIFATRSVFASR